MKQKLVILRGAPASGKTTICKNVRDINKNIVWLSVDGIKPIFSEYKNETLEQANKASLVMLDYLLSQGYSVIYDGIFKIPDHLYQAEEIAKKRGIPFVVYQLDASLKTLQEREKVRDGVKHGLWQPLGDELVAGLCQKIQDNPIEEAIMLDTENKSLDECLDIIRQNFE
ncbi:MAG TPA: zeta toxin family protein [Patescibacteria group bacterium]|nr:zeta toxin family protein [Patescibacteria group bacterium]